MEFKLILPKTPKADIDAIAKEIRSASPTQSKIDASLFISPQIIKEINSLQKGLEKAKSQGSLTSAGMLAFKIAFLYKKAMQEETYKKYAEDAINFYKSASARYEHDGALNSAGLALFSVASILRILGRKQEAAEIALKGAKLREYAEYAK